MDLPRQALLLVDEQGEWGGRPPARPSHVRDPPPPLALPLEPMPARSPAARAAPAPTASPSNAARHQRRRPRPAPPRPHPDNRWCPRRAAARWRWRTCPCPPASRPSPPMSSCRPTGRPRCSRAPRAASSRACSRCVRGAAAPRVVGPRRRSTLRSALQANAVRGRAWGSRGGARRGTTTGHIWHAWRHTRCGALRPPWPPAGHVEDLWQGHHVGRPLQAAVVRSAAGGVRQGAGIQRMPLASARARANPSNAPHRPAPAQTHFAAASPPLLPSPAGPCSSFWAVRGVGGSRRVVAAGCSHRRRRTCWPVAARCPAQHLAPTCALLPALPAAYFFTRSILMCIRTLEGKQDSPFGEAPTRPPAVSRRGSCRWRARPCVGV